MAISAALDRNNSCGPGCGFRIFVSTVRREVDMPSAPSDRAGVVQVNKAARDRRALGVFDDEFARHLSDSGRHSWIAGVVDKALHRFERVLHGQFAGRLRSLKPDGLRLWRGL